MYRIGILSLLAAFCLLPGCGEEAAAEAPAGASGPAAAAAPAAFRAGQMCIDREEGKVVTVVAASGMTTTIKDKMLPPVTIKAAEAKTRLLPLTQVAAHGWISDEDNLAVVFTKLNGKTLRSAYHLPCTLWRVKDGNPMGIERDHFEIAIPLLVKNYTQDPALSGRIRDREAELNREVARRRMAIVMTEADRPMDEIKAEAELELAKYEKDWKRYVETRKQAKETHDDSIYRALLVNAGVRGQGWYASRGDMKSWAQIISTKNISPERIWYRLWKPNDGGTWDVTTVEAPPLVFAANFAWCGDLPGHYPVKGRAYDAVEITLVHGAPPMIQFAAVKDGQIVTGERPDGLGRTWSPEQRSKRLPLPKQLADKIAEHSKLGNVWLRDEATTPADND